MDDRIKRRRTTAVGLARPLLIVIGFITLALGVIGIVLPVLPTTPFLLVSATCWVHSSKRLHHWLIHHRVFGVYIYNYMTYRAVPMTTKIGAVCLLWLSLGFSVWLVDTLHLRIFLVVVGTLVSIHILTLKTLTRDMLQSENHKAPMTPVLDDDVHPSE